LKKRTKKRLSIAAGRLLALIDRLADAISKRFLLLFFKKERLPSFVGPATRRRGALVPDLR
jgi:hypothetical protein